jgi:hypothetical protein
MNSAKQQLHQELMRNFVIERLENLGIQKHDGNSIYSMTYKELLPVLVLAEMHQVDIDHPEHRWFR